jgi:hypothetical protein
MAARRLIAVLVVLLLISSFAAALTPAPQGEETTTTTTAPTADEQPGGGAAIDKRIDAGASGPSTIEARVGDQLRLTVAVEDPSPVVIPGLGRSGFATPEAPAKFDLLLWRGGTFAITLGEGAPVGELRVRR